MMKDFSLWSYVKRTITPFGQPRRPSSDPRLVARKEPDSIDLHGYTIQGAHTATDRAIERALRMGRPSLTVITGKSGEICREFPEWAGLHPGVRGVRTLNGGGAFELRLRKP